MEPHAKPKLDIPKWSALLVEAVNKPGLIMKAYTSFHNYSLSNRLLSLVQCQWATAWANQYVPRMAGIRPKC